MELTIEEIDFGRNDTYPKREECPAFVMKENGMDYGSAVVLLRNLGERKETTSLERGALSAAIRLLQHTIESTEP